jgi:hypothetical protein
VAGKNEATRRAIIIDCPSYPGNSGGPAVEIDERGFQSRLTVIGVVVEWVPLVTQGGLANSGYTVLAPMDGVLDLVEGLEKKP